MCADTLYSTVDTSGYTCIADALHAPDEGIIPTATEESTDDPNALLPSGYKLCNVVPVTTTPPSTTEPRTLASLMASPDTIPPDAAATRASTASKAEGGSGSRRPSTRGAGKAGLETSDTMMGEASGSSADSGIAVAPSRTDSIVSNALALGPESSPHTSSAPSKSSSSGSTPPDPAPISKRNLMGNWAVGCRKMYGMGTPDDLGIWFVFTVSTTSVVGMRSGLMSAVGRVDTAARQVCVAVPVFQLARCASPDIGNTADLAASANG